MNEVEYLHIAVAFLIGFVFPLYAMITGSKTRKILIQYPEKLLTVFKSTSLFLLSLCVLVIISMIINKTEWSIIGLSFIFDLTSVLSLVVLTIASYLVINLYRIPENKIASLKNSYKDVLYILPNTKKEYKASIGLSVIAGICEEIMFRGFLFWQLNQYMPIALSFFITNLMFAIGHAGTKLKNAISTFVLGIVFSIAYLLTDSLWLPILLHIIVDFFAMTIGIKLKSKINKE